MQIMDLMILFYPMVPAILYIPYLYPQFTSYLDCTTYILNSARNYSEAADCIQKGTVNALNDKRISTLQIAQSAHKSL